MSAFAGVAVGAERLRAIDDGAVRAEPGRAISFSGDLVAPPRRGADGAVRVELNTAEGRVAAQAAFLPGSPGVGDGLAVSGRVIEMPPWLAGYYRRRGIATLVETERITPMGTVRGGAAGAIDSIRRRAEQALERGMAPRESALARGFVLGQDDAIDPATAENFRRSGLAHLLAVSGQNVMLLALLGWALLAVFGLTLRARLIALLGLIALYVPLTGAGPSIQRAGVMGAAGLAAALAGRPASRWYALALAAAITLALNPRAGGDVGWQLSFAAVAGLIVLAPPTADLLARGAERGSPRRALAEGAAATGAATLVTAPLTALHFEAVPLVALPANVLALPAVAPAMWLGMLAAMAGQVPAIPVEPLNWLNSLCLAYIAQIAAWGAAPRWAVLEIGLPGPLGLLFAYAVLGSAAALALRAAARRRNLRHRQRGAATAALVAALLLAGGVARAGAPAGGKAPPGTMRVTFIDVGQGDAILLEPPDGASVLVDAGPPGAGVESELRRLGMTRLAAMVITHDQADHSGGAAAVLARFPVERLAYARIGPSLRGAAAAAGAQPAVLAEGSSLRSGSLSLDVLWPPRALLNGPAEDPNRASLVILARWRHLSILLTGDAEAEATGIDPPPLDVLKLAHHGSRDEGLGPLLDHAVPDLAVISVGPNPHGHPAPEVLRELELRGIPVLRTDREGSVSIEAGPGGWDAGPGG